jgi:hypothetical protein
MCLVRITEVPRRGAVYLVDLVEGPAHQVLIPGFKLPLVKMVRPGKGWAFGEDKRELCNTMKPQQRGGREGSSEGLQAGFGAHWQELGGKLPERDSGGNDQGRVRVNKGEERTIMENEGDHGGLGDRLATVAGARCALWLGSDASQ